MKWFKEIDSLDGLRKLYRKLVVRYHPDNGGSENLLYKKKKEFQIYHGMDLPVKENIFFF